VLLGDLRDIRDGFEVDVINRDPDALVTARDGYACTRCGVEGPRLIAHHIRPRVVIGRRVPTCST
jgi:hypothetical protein